MEEWKEYKVGDVFDIQNGYAFRSNEFIDIEDIDTYEVLKIGHIEIGGGLRRDPKRTYIKKNAKIKKWVLKKGDIVMGMTDMKNNVVILGIPAVVDKDDRYVLNQRVARLVIKDPLKFNYMFCYYQMLWNSFITELRKTANSGVQVNLTTKGISQTKLYIPSLPTQQKIANILSSLDDKIEVNRRINEQLEELAGALFKSWFVDFEPFKDGEFVESELGMIPEGWKVCELKDFGQIICGKTPSKDNKDFYGGNIPFIKIPDMHNNIFVWKTTDWLSNKGDASQVNKRIPPYSICVSCIATVGLVAINTTFAHTNQQINTIIPNNAFERYYLFEQLKSMKEYIQNLGRGGTATLNVNTRLFGSIKVLRPSEKVLKEYDDVINGFFKKIELNQQEITHLTNLRDTLLPKLMSGEIDVNEVEI